MTADVLKFEMTSKTNLPHPAQSRSVKKKHAIDYEEPSSLALPFVPASALVGVGVGASVVR